MKKLLIILIGDSDLALLGRLFLAIVAIMLVYYGYQGMRWILT